MIRSTMHKWLDLLPPPVRAGLWMSGTVVSFSLMAVGGREAGDELDTFEIMVYRSLAGLVIVLAVAAAAGRLRSIRFTRLEIHAARNILHFSATNLWLYAVATIPLAQVFAFEFSTPIWAAILAPFVLRERLTAGRMATLALGFAGILIVARPGVVALSPGVYAAILCAVGFAGAAVTTRLLVRHVDVTSVLFWMSLMQLAFAIVLAGYDGDMELPSSRTALPLIVISTAGILAHYCLTNALKLAPAAVVMPFDFARLPLIMLVGYLVYSETIGVFVAIGSAIILLANYISIRAESHSAAGNEQN